MRMYLLAISILVAACADTAVEADTTADEGAVRELIRQTARYNNAADTLGWVGLFEDGAVYMPPGTPEVTTETGLLEVAATGFGSYETSINIEPLATTGRDLADCPNDQQQQHVLTFCSARAAG